MKSMPSAEFFQGALKATPIFSDMQDDHIATIASCAKNMRFHAGQKIYAEGDPADKFLIVREGRVAIDIETPHRGVLTVQTVGPDEVVGWSWLFPPYTWHYNARAVRDTRAIALDGKCLRDKIEYDPKLGYELMKRFSAVMVSRLEAMRMQLMDIYDVSSEASPSVA
ncbi:MAG TPA: cyclic nucleotide-binding domain-containing protein [Polyangiales bacterium]|nr:cyclic nucleotide-binding domain-containing protein [Polyangiales bacterium]